MRKAIALVAAAAIAAGAGCGEKEEPEGGEPVTYSTGTDDAVLQIFTGGGYVPQIDWLRDYPEVVLYGDGRLVTPAPRAVGAEPPPREELEVRQLSPEQTQEVVDAAVGAGLADPLDDYGDPQVTDLPSTTFTLAGDGARHEASVYALHEPVDGPAEVAEAREALAGLADDLAEPEALFGAGTPPAEPFLPDAWLVSRVGNPERCRVVEEAARLPDDADAQVAIRPAIGFDDACKGAFGT